MNFERCKRNNFRDQKNNNVTSFNQRNNNNQKHNNIVSMNNQKHCDNSDLYSYHTKRFVIEYITKSISITDHKFKLIEYEHDLPLLKERKYYVSPNYVGINSFLIFIKMREKYLSCIIDKKQITFNLNKIDYNKIKLIPISCRLEEGIYNGTMIDGVLLHSNFDDKKKFIINDLYHFRGENLMKDKMVNKILNITSYLESTNDDKHINNITFIPNKLYNTGEIEKMVITFIPESEHCKVISGVTFYPEYSGVKLIYLFDNIVENVQNIVKQVHVKKEMNDTLTFRVKKTSKPDIFFLYLGSIIDDNKFKYVKVGIAYIPTIECSHFCKDAFVNSDDTILMNCKYNSYHDAWTPVDVSDKKRPDLYDQLNQKTQQ